MIGNDVIDLELAEQESNWKRNGFLDKVFTISEQQLIYTAEDQTQMVWVLWSIKESVYKAYLRIQHDRGFYPSKIEINSLRCTKDTFHSEVEINGHTFFGKTITTKQCVQTIAAHSKIALNAILFLGNNTLYTKNAKGLPFELYTQKEISVSHHGKFKQIIASKEAF
jgi:phosphopantetheinyl transferase (holo-ACP synthase)